jgi:hypothetical protein
VSDFVRALNEATEVKMASDGGVRETALILSKTLLLMHPCLENALASLFNGISLFVVTFQDGCCFTISPITKKSEYGKI